MLPEWQQRIRRAWKIATTYWPHSCKLLALFLQTFHFYTQVLATLITMTHHLENNDQNTLRNIIPLITRTPCFLLWRHATADCGVNKQLTLLANQSTWRGKWIKIREISTKTTQNFLYTVTLLLWINNYAKKVFPTVYCHKKKKFIHLFSRNF